MIQKVSALGCTLVLALFACDLADAEPEPWFEAGRVALERAKQHAPAPGRAKSVILFVGDGMGVATV